MRDIEIVAGLTGNLFRHIYRCDACGKREVAFEKTKTPLEEPRFIGFWSTLTRPDSTKKKYTMDLCPECTEKALNTLQLALHNGSWITSEAQQKMKEAV